MLAKLQQAELILNSQKYEIRKSTIKFLGHSISEDGVKPDEEEITAIRDMKPPTNVAELRTVLGMINYLAKFIPQLSHHIAPMNMLLCKDAAWTWGPKQQQSFDTIKKLVSRY